MEINNIITGLKENTAQGNLPEVFQALNKLLLESPLLNEALLQSARFNELLKQDRMGLLPYETIKIEKNQIVKGVLELLDEIAKRSQEPGIKEEMVKGLGKDGGGGMNVDNRGATIGTQINDANIQNLNIN